jgi:hypothetical protein
MVVLLLAAEVEILTDLEAPGRVELFGEAAQAYRARAGALQAAGKDREAQADLARATKLEARAAKLKEAAKASAEAEKSKKSASGEVGRIRLVNAWTEPVTVVVQGTSYYLLAGEQKEITRPVGDFTYEVQMLRHWARGKVEAGRVYTIRIRSR